MIRRFNLENNFEAFSFKEHPVQVWIAEIGKSKEVEDSYLSKDELDRANRYAVESDKLEFVETRTNLRLLLAYYLKSSPQSFKFVYNEYGKPAIENKALNFNISHSKNLAVYIFSENREVGIDLEYIRPIKNMDKLMKRFFSKAESQIVKERGEIGFLEIWTKKEALVKAKGKGVWQAMSGSSSLELEGAVIEDYQVQTFEPAPEYIATFASI